MIITFSRYQLLKLLTKYVVEQAAVVIVAVKALVHSGASLWERRVGTKCLNTVEPPGLNNLWRKR